MDYAALYQKKLTSAAEAVKVVKSGDWVDYGWCTNHPYTLDKALAARQNELKDVKVRGGVTMWMPEICKAEDAGEHFTWNSWHCSGIDRKIISKGMGYFIPMRYSELPRFYRDGNATVDVAMIQVTPMDKHGNFSYALACSHLADMLDAAKTVIVEVNENLPWVYGLTGCEINIKDVDMVVEGENPPVAQLGAGGPSGLRIEEGDARQACGRLLLLFVPYQQLADRDRGTGHCGVGRYRRGRLRSVHLAQGQHDPEAVLGHLDGVQPRYGRQLHQRRRRGNAQSDDRQGLVHGLRARPAEEYQRQGG